MRLTCEDKAKLIDFFETYITPQDFMSDMRLFAQEALLIYLAAKDKDHLDSDALHAGYVTLLQFESYMSAKQG